MKENFGIIYSNIGRYFFVANEEEFEKYKDSKDHKIMEPLRERTLQYMDVLCTSYSRGVM